MTKMPPKEKKDFQIGIKSIELMVNSNSTEDPNKIREILYFLISGKNIEHISYVEVNGVYKNPIKLFNLTLKNKSDIDNILKTLANSFTSFEKNKLFREFSKRLSDKNAFYVRLKKSDLARKKCVLTDHSDAIKISISFSNLSTGNVRNIKPKIIQEYLIIRNLIANDRI
jgi:RNA binding exosome subunit